jgi:hypothetical protein
MSNQSLTPWGQSLEVTIPSSATPQQIINYAAALKPADAEKVLKLFSGEDFDVAAEFVWKRGISKLRSTLASLGMRFVGEMLGRPDIDETTSPERALTEYDTIRLASQLGVVSPTGAFRLNQAFETINHFTSEKANDRISQPESTNVLRACVQYLLHDPEIGIALDFANLRARLLQETLPSDDPQLTQLIDSPPFFLGTTTRVLLAAIKTEKGARVEHAIRNLAQILPKTWKNVPEQEKWNLGISYAEASVAGNNVAVAGLRQILHLVSGFDFVPENLRSNSYRKAAQAVVDAHFATNNFYLEAQPTRHLATMGTSIPRPALAECVQAFLCVYIGNRYGYAWNASPIAHDQLKAMTLESWHYYLEKILSDDSVVLGELCTDPPAQRFCSLVKELNLGSLLTQASKTYNLVAWATQGRSDLVSAHARSLWDLARQGRI